VEIVVTVSLQVALAADATAPLDPEVLPRQGAPQRALVQVAGRVGRAAALAALHPVPAVKPDAGRAEVDRLEALPGRAVKLAAAVKPDAERAEVDRREAPPGRAVKLAAAVKPDAGRAEVDRREAPPGRAVKLAAAVKPDAGRAEVDRREAPPGAAVSRTAV
jgi:hypothetical protein